MLVQKIHHVAYRCKDAKETVDWYVKHLDMKFVLAIAENEVPSTKAPDPYMHVFLDAGDRNTPAWVQHLALKVGELHPVKIHQGEPADPGHRQVLAGGAAQSPGADHQHPGLLERLLPLEIERFKNDLTVVAQQLGVAQDLAHSSSPEKGSTVTVSPAATLPRSCSSTM